MSASERSYGKYAVVCLVDLLLELVRDFLYSVHSFVILLCAVILIPQSSLLGCDCNVVTTSVLEIFQISAHIVDFGKLLYFYVKAHSQTTSDLLQNKTEYINSDLLNTRFESLFCWDIKYSVILAVTS